MIDCFASEEHFAHHLAPIYRALVDPGTFYATPQIHDAAASRGVTAFWPIEQTDRPILVASYGDIKKVRRAGRTRIAFIEHGIGQSYGTGHSSYPGGQDRDDVSLFLMPNEYSADLWRKAYPSAQVEIVGSPKLDDLPAREPGPGPVVCISFHFDAQVVDESRSAMTFYRRSLVALKEQFPTLIGHSHPKYRPVATRYYRRPGIPLVEDFADVCRQADVYVCDNSSTLYEFAATGRPVVVLNAPWYRREVNHGLRFWDAADVGIQVNAPDELPEAIRYALTDPPEQQAKREAALRLVYAYRRFGARRAAKALHKWAQSRLEETSVA